MSLPMASVFAGRKEIQGGAGQFRYCSVRGVIFRRFEPEILVSGGRGNWGVLVKEGVRAPDG